MQREASLIKPHLRRPGWQIPGIGTCTHQQGRLEIFYLQGGWPACWQMTFSLIIISGPEC